MNERHKFTLEIIEKLGVPAIRAVTGNIPANSDLSEEDALKQQISLLGELLGESVKGGISLLSILDPKGDESKIEALRLSLVAIICGLLAEKFRQSGRIPADKEIGNISHIFSSLLSFSENFVPAHSNTAHLSLLEYEKDIIDDNLIHVLYLKAMVPAINAINYYSFGVAESRLIQNIAEKLTSRAELMRKNILHSVENISEIKRAELCFFKSMIMLYVDCHEKRTNEILSMDNAEREKIISGNGEAELLEQLWKEFEQKCEMLEVLAPSLLGQDIKETGNKENTAIQEQADIDKAQNTDIPKSTDQNVTATDSSLNPVSSNPMSFFKKKKDEENSE